MSSIEYAGWVPTQGAHHAWKSDDPNGQGGAAEGNEQMGNAVAQFLGQPLGKGEVRVKKGADGKEEAYFNSDSLIERYAEMAGGGEGEYVDVTVAGGGKAIPERGGVR